MSEDKDIEKKVAGETMEALDINDLGDVTGGRWWREWIIPDKDVKKSVGMPESQEDKE